MSRRIHVKLTVFSIYSHQIICSEQCDVRVLLDCRRLGVQVRFYSHYCNIVPGVVLFSSDNWMRVLVSLCVAYIMYIFCVLVVFEIQMSVQFCASKVSVLWLQYYFFRNGVKICKLLYMPWNILIGESTSSLVADLVMCLSTLVYWYGLRDFWLHNYRCTMILLINSRIRIQTQVIRYLAKCFGQFNT